MKTFILLFSLLSVAVAAPAATVYQCPMHPWIKSDHAGDKCTICGMDLVEATAATNGDVTSNLITLTPAAQTVINVQTSPVRRDTLVRTLRVAGVIDDDETRHRILAARVPGRVEKLFVNYVGEEVHEGDPLAVIYSPEMLTAQRQYVERLKAGNAAFTVSDRSAARERLLDLGLTEEEVTILEHTLEPTAMVNLRAPMSGTVVARHVYEGQQLNKDQSEAETRLFEIGDFSSMWFVFDAHETDLAWLHPGQIVEVTTPSHPERVFTAPIAFIDPNLDEMTRTVRVRVVLPNADRVLLHKQTGLGRVRIEFPAALLVPRSAVLQHTGRPVVFVDRGHRGYEPREVRLGRIGDDDAEILSGLTEGERVVTTSALLIDAQAQLARASITVAGVAEPGPKVTVPPAMSRAPAVTYDHLKTLALSFADAAAVLSTDDLAAYQKLLPGLRTALAAGLDDDPRGPLAKFKSGLRDRTDLRTARRDFEPLSTVVADLAREQNVTRREKLHVYQCSMTQVLGTARWLSRDAAPHNPFFGSAMPECGDEVP